MSFDHYIGPDGTRIPFSSETEVQVQIPDQMPTYESYLDNFVQRDPYVQQYGFAYVSWRWVKPLAAWINGRPCLEVMAGRGTLSYALRQLDVNIIATDNYSWQQWQGKPAHTPVENIDAVDAVRKHGSQVNIVIMSWPYMDNLAFQVIKELYAVNPFALLVYIGEGWGGCTADDDFFAGFEDLSDGEQGFAPVIAGFERFSGINDRPVLGRFSPKAHADWCAGEDLKKNEDA